MAYGPDGLARECGVDKPGLLLAEFDRVGASDNALRAVFRADDAWRSTGDRFVKDDGGDYWLVDAADALVHTADGPVAPSRVGTALGRIPVVDLAVATASPTAVTGPLLSWRR